MHITGVAGRSQLSPHRVTGESLIKGLSRKRRSRVRGFSAGSGLAATAVTPSAAWRGERAAGPDPREKPAGRPGKTRLRSLLPPSSPPPPRLSPGLLSPRGGEESWREELGLKCPALLANVLWLCFDFAVKRYRIN